jgi:iron complex transport system permease protein
MMRKSRFFYALLLCLLGLFALNLGFGSADIGFGKSLRILLAAAGSETEQLIIFQSRLPKAITALLCGAALSVSGLLMQTLFRNPLAGPYILGISSGAGLGVALLIMGATVLGISVSTSLSISMAAIIGAVGILLILLWVSFRLNDVMSLLIVGVMIGAIATAIIGMLQYFSTDFELKAFLLWTMGSLEGLNYQEVALVAALCLVLISWAFVQSKPINAFLLGETYAKSIGVSTLALRITLILISGGLAGIITAFCGPIGFVGIVVPHLARMLLKTTNHLQLIPACILIGASILLFSDLLSQLPGNGMLLPINSITSLIGIPIIIWIIFKKRKLSSGF